jgi:hypothetical protein
MPATDSAASSCLCNAGFRLSNDVCAACPLGTFKEAVANASTAGSGCALAHGCCACGANEATLLVARVTSEWCKCGFGGMTCAQCAAGFFKALTSDEACDACPAGSTTIYQGSVSATDCVAAPGFFGNV